jgi:hypothetical protein
MGEGHATSKAILMNAVAGTVTVTLTPTTTGTRTASVSIPDNVPRACNYLRSPVSMCYQQYTLSHEPRFSNPNGVHCQHG